MSQFQAKEALPPGKELQVSIKYEDGWIQSLSGRCGEEKTLPYPCQELNLWKIKHYITLTMT
jgi:hypothetical protein